MDYTAKKEEFNPTLLNTGRFELTTTEVVKDVSGKNVTIPKSMGFYSLDQLNADKVRFTEQLADIDAKIAAITAIINAG